MVAKLSRERVCFTPCSVLKYWKWNFYSGSFILFVFSFRPTSRALRGPMVAVVSHIRDYDLANSFISKGNNRKTKELDELKYTNHIDCYLLEINNYTFFTYKKLYIRKGSHYWTICLFRYYYYSVFIHLSICVPWNTQVQGLISIIRATSILLLTLRPAKQSHRLLVYDLERSLSKNREFLILISIKISFIRTSRQFCTFNFEDSEYPDPKQITKTF